MNQKLKETSRMQKHSKMNFFTVVNNTRCSNNRRTSINEEKIDEIEIDYFKRLKTSIERFYVPIFDDENKIWTLSANTNSTNIPIVLVHGFMASIVVWSHNIG